MFNKNGNETSAANYDDTVSDRPSRRQVLRAAAVASLAAFPFNLAKLAFPAHAAGHANSNVPISAGPAKNPAWYGFNLLEYFSTDADGMNIFRTRMMACLLKTISAGFTIGASTSFGCRWIIVSGRRRTL